MGIPQSETPFLFSMDIYEGKGIFGNKGDWKLEYFFFFALNVVLKLRGFFILKNRSVHQEKLDVAHKAK